MSELSVKLISSQQNLEQGLRANEKVNCFPEQYVASNHSGKEDLLEYLVGNFVSSEEREQSSYGIEDQLKKFLTPNVENIQIEAWKNIKNISSRLLEVNEETYVLECLVDSGTFSYEERTFPKSLFEGLPSTIGSYYYLRIFQRRNEIKMEVHEGSKLVSESDFPKRNFKKIISESKLFKK